MRHITLLAFFLPAAVLFGCAAEPAEPESTAQTASAFAYEIPATVQGAVVWRFAIDGQAVAVAKDGHTIVALRTVRAAGSTTIERAGSGERVVLDDKGNVLENTMTDATFAAVDALQRDTLAYEQAHPDRPMGCGWDLFKAWASCAAAVGVCVHPLTSWLGCASMAGGCGVGVGDYVNNCGGGDSPPPPPNWAPPPP